MKYVTEENLNQISDVDLKLEYFLFKNFTLQTNVKL